MGLENRITSGGSRRGKKEVTHTEENGGPPETTVTSLKKDNGNKATQGRTRRKMVKRTKNRPRVLHNFI